MSQGVKNTSWLDGVPGRLRAKIDAMVDCDAEPLAAIYRRLNLVRFCQPRTFRLYAGPRRRRLRERDARRHRIMAAVRHKEQTTRPTEVGGIDERA